MSSSFVYTMTNSDIGNEIIAYKLESSSKLVKIGSFETRGKGSGKKVVNPLVSQGSIAISALCNLLFAVNVESNTISVFKIISDGTLMLITVVSSYGVRPVALSTYENILVVANKGDENTPSNIALFAFSCNGFVRASCQPNFYELSSKDAYPSSITINPDNILKTQILVSELNLSKISIFDRVGCRLNLYVVNKSATPDPFVVLALENGIILSVEVGRGRLVSYYIDETGKLKSLESEPTNGQGSCWMSVTPNNEYVYVSNIESGTISVFSLKPNGRVRFLRLVDSVPGGIAAPMDSSISPDGKYLYVLNGDVGSISTFKINSDGSLDLLDVLVDEELPKPGSQGMASY